VAIADSSLAPQLRERVPQGTEVLAGPDALAAIARSAEVVLNGVVGFAGLPVTLAALESGRRLALANKESLIAGGPVVQRARATDGAEIIPVDSEHCAVHQCLHGLRAGKSPPGDGSESAQAQAAPSGNRWPSVRRIILTASGGPFRGRGLAELTEVTVADALAHPTWRMGPKITIDSSTLMNKGLEVIEAHQLFGIDYDRIDVVVHPQSIVHSMVEATDGATLAQLSQPDMRLPIGYALAYPDRLETAFGPIDWTVLSRLDFELPDRAVFRCLELAYQAGRLGGTAPACLSAANEVAVDAFLGGRIRWTAIAEVIEETLARVDAAEPDGVEAVLEADRWARREAGREVVRRVRVA
jgi:1-deoxy-D-xylulose-5-phosphate reductoisomerase